MGRRVRTIEATVDVIGSSREYEARTATEKQRGGFLWPELRVGRSADYNDQANNVWNTFLNEMGSTHARLGHTRVLGELSCHYVTDTEMRRMIEKRHGISVSPRDATKVYREVGRQITGYIRSEMYSGSERIELREYGWNLPRSCGLGLIPLHFQPGALIVPRTESAFKGYTPRKLALDLSHNDFLYEERDSLVRFMRRGLGLDTSMLRGDWEPHMTVLESHEQLRVDGRRYEIPLSLPSSIAVGPVQAISENVDFKRQR